MQMRWQKGAMYNLLVFLVCLTDLVVYEIFLFFVQKKREREKEQDKIKTFSHSPILQQILATVAVSDRNYRPQNCY